MYLDIMTVKLVEKEPPGTVNRGRGLERKQELRSFRIPVLRRTMAGTV